MAENLHLILDILALLAVAYAIVKGIFSAGSDTARLKREVELHSQWILDHQECNQKQISILSELREDIAYLRGRYDSEKETK